MSIDDPNGSPDRKPGNPSNLQRQVGNDVETATHQAKHDLDAIAQQARADVKDLGHEAKAQVSKATDKAKGFASDQKDLAAGQINGVAAAITKVADELDGTDQQVVARYARDLASGLSGVGKTIEERDVDDLMGLAQDFGRQQPVAFLGAAALAGFVASRFAMASAHRRENKVQSTTPNAETPSTSIPATSRYDRTGGL